MEEEEMKRKKFIDTKIEYETEFRVEKSNIY
jgi:hypothetical protein